MKVLMLAPLWYPISRDAPGGIETFLYRVVDALQARGCQVTLLACGDSSTAAELLPVVERGLYEQMSEGTAGEYVYYEQHQIGMALGIAAGFDAIHSHIGPGGYILDQVPAINVPVLHTIHWPVYRDMEWYVSMYPTTRLATVSEQQAAKLRQAGAINCAVVPNGIDPSDFTFNDHPAAGLVFLGRIEAAKGPDLAVSVARSLGLPLTLAGPITDSAFFADHIEPFLGVDITYVGVVDHSAKNRLLGNAACAVLPFRQAEPFGLVSIEAMVCGTPVVALSKGALPEIIEPGVTGYLAPDELSLEALTLQAISLDRAAVRDRAVSRFGIDRTTDRYIALYRTLHAQHQNGLPGKSPIGDI
jgi:glycosyltransferase involved in cell wall biosynthesis